MALQHQDRILVERNGEEVELFNWVNVSQYHVVRGGNPVTETFEPDIGAGDSSSKPEAVTKWVADELWHNLGIDVENHGIVVVDVESDDVKVL